MVDDDNTVRDNTFWGAKSPDPTIREPTARPRYRRTKWAHPHVRTPLLVIGAGLLALLLIVAVTAYGSRTDRAARDLRAAAGRVVEKRRQVEETRQLLEQRLAELAAAQTAVAAGTDRLDAAIARDHGKRVTTGAAAGEVLPMGNEAEVRARESLRRGDAALRSDSLHAAPLRLDSSLPPLPPVRRP
jgi:hypothetical protein